MKNNILIAVAGSLVLGLTGCTDVTYPEPTYQEKKKHDNSQAQNNVNYGKMQTFCRGEAAGFYNLRPMYVQVGNVKERNNKYVVKGTADLGSQGQKAFKCVFDGNGNFVRVQSMVNEGRL